MPSWNYGQFVARQRTRADVELAAVGCHPEYDFETQIKNFAGAYSIFPRYLAGAPVHRHMLRYPLKWRERYGAPGDGGVPTVGVITLFEGHESGGQVAKTLDADLARFLRAMATAGALADTIIAFGKPSGSCGRFRSRRKAPV